MIFIERPHFVDAVRYTGDNIDEVRSAAMLAGVEIREPTDPSLNHMASSIAVMQPSGTWAYLFPGMWAVRDVGALGVWDDSVFRQRFCTLSEAGEAGEAIATLMGPEAVAS